MMLFHSDCNFPVWTMESAIDVYSSPLDMSMSSSTRKVRTNALAYVDVRNCWLHQMPHRSFWCERYMCHIQSSINQLHSRPCSLVGPSCICNMTVCLLLRWKTAPGVTTWSFKNWNKNASDSMLYGLCLLHCIVDWQCAFCILTVLACLNTTEPSLPEWARAPDPTWTKFMFWTISDNFVVGYSNR